MDRGQLNYIKYTEGNSISLGESTKDGSATTYIKTQGVLKKLREYYSPPVKYLNLQRVVKRTANKTYEEFCDLMEKRMEKIRGEVKLQRIHSLLDEGKMDLAVTEILR